MSVYVVRHILTHAEPTRNEKHGLSLSTYTLKHEQEAGIYGCERTVE